MKKGSALLSCCLVALIPCGIGIVLAAKAAMREKGMKQYEQALKSHDVALVKGLLDYGFDPNTFLSDFADNNPVTIFKYKLTGQEPQIFMSDRPFERRYTGVGYAAQHSDYEMTKVLLEHGASANPYREFGAFTPLGRSASNDNYRMCALLLMHGADPNGEYAGETALDLAEGTKDKKLIRLLKSYHAKNR